MCFRTFTHIHKTCSKIHLLPNNLPFTVIHEILRNNFLVGLIKLNEKSVINGCK